jgi:hypothetical protein
MWHSAGAFFVMICCGSILPASRHKANLVKARVLSLLNLSAIKIETFLAELKNLKQKLKSKLNHWREA